MRTVIVTSVVGLLALVCVEGLFLPGEQFTCCGPDDVWEADEGLMVGTNEGGGSLTQASARLSYNNSAQMVNQYMEEWTNGVSRKFRVLQDFKKKTQYTVFNGSCYPEPILYDFIPSCVPANATKVTSSYYGPPDRQFKVDIYKSKLLGLDAYISVNPDPDNDRICFPMSEVLYGQMMYKGKLVNVMENFGFTNYRKGTMDPHVFDLPPECQKATTHDQMDVIINRLRRSVFA